MGRILLINPAAYECGVPHTGLAMLSTVLQQHGHIVKIADYHFSFQLPVIKDLVDDFKPNLVGISLLSSTAAMIKESVAGLKDRNIPSICGGPHTSSYYEDLSNDSRFDYVVVGEAENIISDLVETATVNRASQVIHAPCPDVNRLPFPDYTSFYNYERISLYPLITSRGCPFNCSFCSIGLSNSREWRARSLESCIEELKRIKSELPTVREVMIWDDNFSLDLERAKSFLHMFRKERLGYNLNVANVRADKIDKEFLLLLKEAGCKEIQFGVEHGNPEVFQHIGKGEALEDISRAAKLVNECKMKLGCSFIIGLPHDTLKRTLDSIKLVRRLRPDHIHWNILVPYRGTQVYGYFKAHGTVDDNYVPFTVPLDPLSFEPNADTPYFTREERKKAYLMALLMTGDTSLLPDIRKTFDKARRYNLISEFLLWFINPKIIKSLILSLGRRMLRRRRQI